MATRQTKHRTKTPPGKKDERQTPKAFFEAVQRKLGVDFTLDVAASRENRLCDQYRSLEPGMSAFDGTWGAGGSTSPPEARQIVWCNPPYSDALSWVRLCRYKAHEHGHFVVMCLQPRTDVKSWFHRPLGVLSGASEIVFVTPRVHFPYPGGPLKGSPDFGTMLVVFSPTLDSSAGPRVWGWNWKEGA